MLMCLLLSQNFLKLLCVSVYTVCMYRTDTDCVTYSTSGGESDGLY